MHSKLLSTLSKYNTIILVGGGTGGHIQPIVSMILELENKKLLWMGGKNSEEEKTAKKNNILFESIPMLKLATTKSPKILLYPFILLQGIFQTRKIIQKQILVSQEGKKANLVRICLFSKGGPGSVAVGIAAWTLGLPLYIHESDTVPGRSNRVLGKLATKIFLGFESAEKYFKSEKCETIGQILNPLFSSKNTHGSISWKTDKKHILVICGSQGAKSIFAAVLIQFARNTDYEWIIALGKLNSDMKKSFENMKDTQAVDWLTQEDTAFLLQRTDISITRGSATTLAELDLFGIKKIIIPLPYAADNHQYWNAKEYEKKGDIVLEQKDINELSNFIRKYVSRK